MYDLISNLIFKLQQCYSPTAEKKKYDYKTQYILAHAFDEPASNCTDQYILVYARHMHGICFQCFCFLSTAYAWHMPGICFENELLPVAES
jgi:hypothetical protein